MDKVINYCWFGGNPLGKKELACIESWKRFFPDYEIKQWDETNFDVMCCDYVREAYEAKKWAFVSDYARFAILYKTGGLYFDTDVEVIKSFDDVLDKGPFMGMETDPVAQEGVTAKTGFGLSVNPGLGLFAVPGIGLYRAILDSYESDHFIKADGRFNYRTVVERVTEILLEKGLKPISEIQNVDGILIYPSAYFNPTDLKTGEVSITSVTHSIHHFEASWQPKSLRRVGALKQMIKSRIPFLPQTICSFIAWGVYIIQTGDMNAFKERY